VLKVESKNAYLVTLSPNTSADIVLLMCDGCGIAKQCEEPMVGRLIEKDTALFQFEVHRKAVEVQGLCKKCQVSMVQKGYGFERAKANRRGFAGAFQFMCSRAFLGAVRPPPINFLAKQSEFVRTLVLINEFGEVGLDHDLVTFSGDELAVQMASGCVVLYHPGRFSENVARRAGKIFSRVASLGSIGSL
jgi:hypothetical protein